TAAVVQAGQAGLGGNICEMVVSIIAQKQIPDLSGLDDGGQEKKIQLAVTVVVKHNDDAAEAVAQLPPKVGNRPGTEIGRGCPTRGRRQFDLELLALRKGRRCV